VMAGGLSFYGAGLVLNHILRAVVPTYPATFYMRLLTTPSTKGSSGTEAAYGGYARLALVRGLSLFTDPVLTGRSTNAVEFAYPVASSPGSDIVAWDIVETASGIFTATFIWGFVNPPRSITVGKPPKFPIGSCEVTA
jgi:hypothetical protein